LGFGAWDLRFRNLKIVKLKFKRNILEIIKYTHEE